MPSRPLLLTLPAGLPACLAPPAHATAPQVYDGAVYLYQGRPHLCRKLNVGERVALVRPADIKYYTKLRDYVDVHVTGRSGV